MTIFGPRRSSRISALTFSFARSAEADVTVSPSTKSSAGSSIVLPAPPGTRFRVTKSPTETFSWRPPARTIAYTTWELTSLDVYYKFCVRNLEPDVVGFALCLNAVDSRTESVSHPMNNSKGHNPSVGVSTEDLDYASLAFSCKRGWSGVWRVMRTTDWLQRHPEPCPYSLPRTGAQGRMPPSTRRPTPWRSAATHGGGVRRRSPPHICRSDGRPRASATVRRATPAARRCP